MKKENGASEGEGLGKTVGTGKEKEREVGRERGREERRRVHSATAKRRKTKPDQLCHAWGKEAQGFLTAMPRLFKEVSTAWLPQHWLSHSAELALRSSILERLFCFV